MLILFVFQPVIPCIAYDYTIWDIKNDDFWQRLNENDPKLVAEKQKVLDSQIELNFNYQLQSVNLEHCIQTALEKNFDIKLFSTRANISNYQYKGTLTQFLPDFYYNYKMSFLSGKFLVGGILPIRIEEIPLQSSFVVDLSVAKQGRLFFNAQSNKNYYKSSLHKLDFSIDETLLYTALAYYDLLDSKLQMEILRINLLETQEQLRYTQTAYDVGIGTKFDVLRAQTEVENAMYMIQTEMKAVRIKQARLANLMGIDVFLPLYPFEVDISTNKLLDDEISLEEFCKLALTMRDDIKAKKMEIKALKIIKKSNIADFFPDINLEYQNNQVGTARIGMSMNNTGIINTIVPLGKNLGATTHMNYKADDAKLKAAEIELTMLERQIKENLVNSFYNSKIYEEKIQVSIQEVKAADQAARMSMARMKEGEETFLNVISAQRTKTASRTQLLQSVINYNKAQIQLLFDSGIISPKNILTNYQKPLIP